MNQTTYFCGKKETETGKIIIRVNLSKGQLISKCLYEIIVWTKISTNENFDSFCPGPFRAEIIKFFVGILVQAKTSKRHFEIN